MLGGAALKYWWRNKCPGRRRWLPSDSLTKNAVSVRVRSKIFAIFTGTPLGSTLVLAVGLGGAVGTGGRATSGSALIYLPI
jgi:hypothetical protein